MKNRSKKEVMMGRPLGIDFLSMLVDFGTQVGSQNGQKIDPRRHRKNDEKMKDNKMASGAALEPSQVPKDAQHGPPPLPPTSA